MPDNGKDNARYIDRRQYLYLMGVGGTSAALAGCSGAQENAETSAETTGGGGGGGSETSASTTTAAPETKRTDKTFIVGMSSKASTLDPHKATRLPEKEIITSFAEPLFRDNPEKDAAPHLLADYSMNDDATKHTFTLKEGVTFHDGEELTADIAKWNMDRIIDQSPTASDISPDLISNIEATGDYEFVMEYSEPFPLLSRFLTTWNFAMVSKKAVEEAGDKFGQSVVVGTGPYKFSEWKHGTAVITERFEDYDWGPEWLDNRGPGLVGKFRFEHHPEASTLLNELESGDVHGSKSVLLAYAKDIEDNPNTKLARKKFTRQGYLCPNCQKEPFTDPEVRRAVVNAVNKQAVITSAVNGEGYPIWNCVTPVHKNSLGPEKSKELGQTFDPEKARERLENAGWTNSKKGEVRTKNGKKLEIDFFTYTIEREKRVGKAVAPMLKNVGFKVNLKILEAGTLYKQVEAGEHNLLVMALGGTYGLGWLEQALHSSRWFTKGGCCNFSIWGNDEFDSLIEKAKKEPDQEKRAQMVKDAQEIALKEAPVVPMLGYNKIFGYKNEVGGVNSWTKHPWWPVEQYNQRMELYLKGDA